MVTTVVEIRGWQGKGAKWELIACLSDGKARHGAVAVREIERSDNDSRDSGGTSY